MNRDLPENDYVLIDGAAWFTVGNNSVRIVLHAGELRIAVYPLGHEMENPIGLLTLPE